MKILRPPDGSLLVQVRPGFVEWVLGLTALLPLWIYLAEGALPPDKLRMALLASAIALGCLAFFAEWSEFTFDANRRQLRWRRRTAFGLEHGELPLADILDVTVSSRLSSGESYQVHRVVLHLPSGPLALTRYYQTGRRSEATASEIRAYLAARGVTVPRPDRAVKRGVTALEQEADGSWWGRLECGHRVPVRNDPPWADLGTPESRARIVGMIARCAECESKR